MLVGISVPEGTCLCLNGAFIGTGGTTVPVTGDTVVAAYPPGRGPRWCHLFPAGDGLRAAPGDGCLIRRADTFTLSFPDPPCCTIPPVPVREKPWRGGSVALCGGALVHEAHDGTLSAFPGAWEDYRILSEDAVLLSAPGRCAVVNGSLKPLVTPADVAEVNTARGRLELTLTVPGFDCFTIRRVYALSPFSLLDTSLLRRKDAPLVPCFAQAVRLGAIREAAAMMTPSLAADMTVKDVVDFLGPFDRCEKTDDGRPDALALRYCIDEWNYRYMCYAFTLEKTTSAIDDIEQYI